MSLPEKRFTLGLLALDGAILSGVAGPMDILRVAQKLAQIRDPATPIRLDAVLVGARGQSSVTGTGGLTLGPVQSPDRALDLLLVPGFMHSSADDLLQRLEGYAPEMELLRAMQLRGVPLAASCRNAGGNGAAGCARWCRSAPRVRRSSARDAAAGAGSVRPFPTASAAAARSAPG